MMNAKICFLGGGNMAESIISGLVAEKFAASTIAVTDVNEERLLYLEQRYKVSVSSDVNEAVKHADIVLFCVKPQSVEGLMAKLKPSLKDLDHALYISIVAGLPIVQLQQWVPATSAIVRVMPNTPAIMGCGATGLYANEATSRQQKEMAEQIMRKVGVTTWVDKEALIDVVTAISGSGPAYFFLMMEQLIASAVKAGLSHEQATLLVTQTALGSSKMALDCGQNIAKLRQNVTSKGGVTAAALKSMMNDNLTQLIDHAVEANLQRSKELGKLFDKAISYDT